jgi:hypothetical protein
MHMHVFVGDPRLIHSLAGEKAADQMVTPLTRRE